MKIIAGFERLCHGQVVRPHNQPRKSEGRINMGPKTKALKVAAQTLLLIAGFWLAQPIAFAASANTSLLKAKQEAEAKGQIFFGSRDEIVNKAKKEGKLRVVSGLVDSLPTTTAAFRKRYPFIDLQVEILKGVDWGPAHCCRWKAVPPKTWISCGLTQTSIAIGCPIFGKSTFWAWPSTEYLPFHQK